MEEPNKNSEMRASQELGAEVLAQMVAALRDAIPRDKANLNAFRMLDYLAQQTAELAGEGKEPLVPTKNIYYELSGNPNQEPSAWVSQLWKALEERLYGQIEASVRERSQAYGLDSYLRPTKIDGSPALYTLTATPLSGLQSAPRASEMKGRTGGEGAVVYQQDLTLKLSLPGRMLFGRGLAWTRPKKIVLAIYLVVVALLLMVISYGGYLALARSSDPLSAAGVLTLMAVFGIPWATMRGMDKALRIFDDRIVIAPGWALAWREFGATMELEGELESGGTKAIKVVRYTAPCPICEGMLKLDYGEPDFPRRLVGRCTKSPREHVFSFDRITRRGKALITPT